MGFENKLIFAQVKSESSIFRLVFSEVKGAEKGLKV